MPPDSPPTFGPSDPPIKVLLVGNRWDAFETSLAGLAGWDTVEFVGPMAQDWRAALPRELPAVVGVAPDFDPASIMLSRQEEGTLCPAVLLFVTPQMLEEDGLLGEADDFLVAPSTTAELAQRIRRLAILSRVETASSQLQMGQITLLLDTYQVMLGSRRVDLAWMEFKLLRFLMENPGRVFSREQLLAYVWGVESFVGTRTVDVHIRRLRSKLGVSGDEYFRTVKNVGYGLMEPQPTASALSTAPR